MKIQVLAPADAKIKLQPTCRCLLRYMWAVHCSIHIRIETQEIKSSEGSPKQQGATRILQNESTDQCIHINISTAKRVVVNLNNLKRQFF